MSAPSKTAARSFHCGGNDGCLRAPLPWASWIALGALALTGCAEDRTTAAVGLSCVPRDEYQAGFAGFSPEEITIETVNESCAAESVCLVKSFRGRVSCPYGQTIDDLNLSTEDPRRCVIPKHAAAPVVVEVQPQLKQTSGSQGVYCSALCADGQGNRGDGRSYHDCPSGYHCETLVDSLLLTSQELDGSYCVRNDSPTRATLNPESCQLTDGGGNGPCGAARPYP